MTNLPTGTVTFLFSDIEGSTKRWETHARAMHPAFARQEAILRRAIQSNGGYAYKMIGDAFQAAFPTAPQALQAALDAQRALYAEPWPQELGDLRVRMALHTGSTEEREGDYVGPVLNRIARLLSAGHGGQTLLTLATEELVRDHLPPNSSLVDLGEHRLKDLQRPEHVFQLAIGDLPSHFPPLKTLDNRPNNLPIQVTPFVGREHEVSAASTLLRRRDTRLLTLVGPGGTGKTRLALQVAAELLEEFEDGVFFVALAPVSDPTLVAPTIAQTLHVKETGDQTLLESLKGYLRDKEALLLLDNFEQVGEASPLVGALLGAAPGLKMLVTSREMLHVYGEKEFPVSPLALPDRKHMPPLEQLTQYEAVRLFIERAKDVKPDFRVTNENAPAVAEICVRLDGLPLAIELAAARIRLLPPQALLGRLQSRLKMLTGGAKDVPARQQTLRSTIEWSYDLLGTAEQKLFPRLAVFAGGCTLEAVEAVCNPGQDVLEELEIDTLDGVSSLVDKSLLRQEEGAEGEARFVMLETVREYARERLHESGEEDAVRRLHANFFLAMGEEVQSKLTGPDQVTWLKRLEPEHDNMRAALAWSWEEVTPNGPPRDVEVGARLAIAWYYSWYRDRSLSEGREWFERALVGLERTEGPEHASARATVLLGAGLVAMHQGDVTTARPRLEASVEVWRALGDKRGLARALIVLGATAVNQGDEQAALLALEESQVLARELGEKPIYLGALMRLGDLALGRGDYAMARSRYEEYLTLQRQAGHTWGIAHGLNNLGEIARCEGDYGRAELLYNESLSLFREVGATREIPRLIHNLGYVAQQQGDYNRAAARFKESLTLFQELGNKRGAAECLAGLGGVAGAQGQQASAGRAARERAATLLGAARAQLDAVGAAMWPADRIEYERNLASLRSEAHGKLEEANWKQAWDGGQAMSMEQAIAYALEES